MKNFKKLIALVLFLAITLAPMTTSHAEAHTHNDISSRSTGVAAEVAIRGAHLANCSGTIESIRFFDSNSILMYKILTCEKCGLYRKIRYY